MVSPWFWTILKIFKFRRCILPISLLSSLWKRRCPSFEQSWIPFTKGWYVSNLMFEMGPVFLEKKTKKLWKVYNDNNNNDNDDGKQRTNLIKKAHSSLRLRWAKIRWNIYTTKGRDQFHWAATPLIYYKVGNICHMTYRYSVLFFLNLSLKHFLSHRKRQFLWKYPNPETVIVPCFNVSRMPNRRTSQSKIEDIVHCKCISLLN